jgi:hypothetical protein
VPQRDVRGAAKFGITAFSLMFCYTEWPHYIMFNPAGLPLIFFNLKGAVNQKKVEKHWPSWPRDMTKLLNIDT